MRPGIFLLALCGLAQAAHLSHKGGKCDEWHLKIENGEAIEHSDYQPDMVPDCDEDGNFRPKQCHVFSHGDKWCKNETGGDCYHFTDGEEWCICVDPHSGDAIKGTETPAGMELDCDAPHSEHGKCHEHLLKIEKEEPVGHSDYKPGMVPDCDEDGNFKPKQCHVFSAGDKWCDEEKGETGDDCYHFSHGEEWCICVDPHSGDAIKGTETPAGMELDCEAPHSDHGPCREYVHKIQSGEAMEHSCYVPGFVPKCDEDGNFEPKQCHVFSEGDEWCDDEKKDKCYTFPERQEWCVCVDPHSGEAHKETATQGRDKLICEAPHSDHGPCREYVHKIQSGEAVEHSCYVPGFVPKCDKDGNFEPKQCHVFSAGDEWCDDEHKCHIIPERQEWCVCVDPHSGEAHKETATQGRDKLHCGPGGGAVKPCCAPGWTHFGRDHHELCYNFINDEKTWAEAESYCQFHGGHLASIHCEETNHFLTALALEQHDIHLSWAGGHNTVSSSCFWMWSDGTPFEFEDWYREQDKFRKSSCLRINAGYHFQWSSGCCNETLPFVCSRETECGHRQNI